VLSAGTPRELIAALAAGDAARFQAVPGIGKRTAERIIVELREKVGVEAGPSARMPIVARRGEPAQPRTLAREGLLELGYGPEEADELLREAEGDSAEDLLGHALRVARTGS
jgi:Holliday junction DNA helicase RuvA